jgi:nucleotide-binding universal stress UspA family protein
VLFGSVATEVLRHATCPVLTARLPLPPAETSGVRLEPADFATTGTDGGVMWPIKSILHPTDFSESSAKAFEAARALAADHHAKLIVLHVTSVPDLAYKGYGAPGAPLEEEEYIDKARRDLASLTSPSGIVLERLLEEGDAASQILRVANELKPDLVVMGTHGRSGLRHVLLGSVAEQIVRKATCPVLTVRAPAE